MLAGVLNGMMKSAPVLILERSRDIKQLRATEPGSYSSDSVVVQHPWTRLELVAWQKKIFVLLFDGDELVHDGHTTHESHNWEKNLQEDLQHGSIVYFIEVFDEDTGESFEDYPHQMHTAKLTKEGRALLSVWTDKLLEEMG